MSLVRTALRMAALNALKGSSSTVGPTIAHNRVYDSRISDFSPETYPDDAKATVIITTDDDVGDGLSSQNGGPPFRRMIDLVLEFAMVQGFDVEGEGFLPGYPATDAEHEASLDFLEFQIARRLAYDLDEKCALFRSFTRVWKHDCHRQVTDETGVKIAARVLTWTVEVSDDQVTIQHLPDDPVQLDLDRLPTPLRLVAQSLPAGTALDICHALADELSPLQAGPLQGFDMTVDNTAGEDLSDMFDVSVEIRSALEVPQIVAGGDVVIDYAKGTFQNLIITGNITSMTVINWPAMGKAGRLILQTTNTGAFTIAWPAGTEWAGGQVGQVTSGAGKKDIFVLTTVTAGAETFGNIIGTDYHT